MQELQTPDVVVAGHICLDMIPEIDAGESDLPGMVSPGRLIRLGPVTSSLGGAVANAGGALHRLGLPVRLIGKTGQDAFGQIVSAELNRLGDGVADGMIVDPRATTSYTFVLNPPGVDRCFLHHPGANDSFSPGEIGVSHLRGARLLHFGYPPLMRGVCADDGAALTGLFRTARSMGVLTSLDMAMPGQAGEGGTDWPVWLTNVLPAVDLFAPSLDELLLMLFPDEAGSALSGRAGVGLLRRASDALLEMGASVVVLKLGEHGLYLRSGDGPAGFPQGSPWSRHDWDAWCGREVYAPCLKVDAVGTTGSGDCTIAGLIAALLQGERPEGSLATATGVGAFCVEGLDATSNIPTLGAVASRIAAGWERREPSLDVSGWSRCGSTGVWLGLTDHVQSSRS